MSTQSTAEPFGRLTPQQAQDRITSGTLTVVDVREGWEYARDHIAGANNVPLGQIISRPEQSLQGKEDNLLFVCEVGQRSGVAAELAAAAGKKNVFNLEGGMQAWRAAGNPVDR